MAITPRDNEAFYREVDEEVRREQLKGFWKRYGKLSIAGAILFLAALGGYFWWQNQQQLKAGEKGAELTAALDDVEAGNKAAANARLDQLAKSDRPGYRVAALLSKANLEIKAGNLPAAASIFKGIADNQDYAKPYRELATIRMTALELDRLPPQAVIDRLKPYAVAGNPWFGSAGEMVAISYMKLNKPGDAARIFAAMAKDPKVPQSIQARSVQMAGSLGVDAMPEPAGATGEKRQ